MNYIGNENYQLSNMVINKDDFRDMIEEILYDDKSNELINILDEFIDIGLITGIKGEINEIEKKLISSIDEILIENEDDISAMKDEIECKIYDVINEIKDLIKFKNIKE